MINSATQNNIFPTVCVQATAKKNMQTIACEKKSMQTTVSFNNGISGVQWYSIFRIYISQLMLPYVVKILALLIHRPSL